MTKTIPEESLGMIAALCAEYGAVIVDYALRGHERRMILDLFIDSERGVTLELCSAISRALNDASATDKFLGNVYTLDVSSPGVDRPLKFNWQYNKHVGRLMNITLHDGSQLRGRLASVDEIAVVLDLIKGNKKRGMPNSTPAESRIIPFSDIDKALVEVEF